MTNNDLTILQNFNVLYLEDDENLLKHTKSILEDFVNNIYTAKTSSEALDILLHRRIDVIICDILLKDENGIDFLKYIKSKIRRYFNGNKNNFLWGCRNFFSKAIKAFEI